MGNQVEPQMPVDPEGYVKNENWGAQINFMVPLDGGIVERCKSIAARQEEKMQLDYELVRIKNCAELQQKGFMIRPNTRVYNICSDVIPIAAFKKEQKQAKENPLIKSIYNDPPNQANPFSIPEKRFSEATRNRFTFGLRKKN
jgi:hypothetical protein